MAIVEKRLLLLLKHILQFKQENKKLPKKNREDILSSEELAANLFRITQTESRLKKDNIDSEKAANKTRYNIGKNIKEVIAKNG